MTPEDKARTLLEPQMIRLQDGLPCASQECMNTATVARAEFSQRQNCWLVTAVCRVCTAKLVQMYADAPQEG